MKRFLVVLLALGMILAFSMPAAATDVKFSGEYYVTGYYDDNHDLMDSSAINGNGASSAWYQQRLRVNTIFQVAEGLKLVTRFDAMERVWGSTILNQSTSDKYALTEQNFSWERAYVQFAIPTGQVLVGYQSAGTIGTAFGDYEYSNPRIRYNGFFGDWIVVALLQKITEGDLGTNVTDADYDAYALAVIKKFKGGQVGICDFLLSSKTAAASSSLAHYTPAWFKWKSGNLYLEGEMSHYWGTKSEDDDPTVADVDRDGWDAYLMVNFDLGQFYVGGQFAYVSGDDVTTTTEDENAWGGKQNYNPCLILWNEDLNKYMGTLGGTGTMGSTSDGMTNAMFYQIFAGMKPMEKLDVKASFSYANADEKPASYLNDDYGTEFDITATYKLYDNLTYMVGFGYLWTGDYYKGTSAANKVDDNYIVMNKLTLKF